MQSTRADKIIALGVPIVCFTWYLTPVGGGWIFPLTRTGGEQFTYAIFILAAAVVLGIFYLSKVEQIGYLGRFFLPPLVMLIVGGLCVLATNAIAPHGMERLANSVSKFGWMAQVRNILAFGLFSGAWAFGFLFAIPAVVIKLLEKRGQ